MAKKKNPIKQIGTTITGKPIMGGLFQMADTHGFPLVFSIDECENRGWVASIPDYVDSAVRAGWTLERALRGVKEACSDRGDWDSFPAIEAGIRLMDRSKKYGPLGATPARNLCCP